MIDLNTVVFFIDWLLAYFLPLACKQYIKLLFARFFALSSFKASLALAMSAAVTIGLSKPHSTALSCFFLGVVLGAIDWLPIEGSSNVQQRT